MHKRIYWFIGFFSFVLIATFAFYGVKRYMISWYMARYRPPPVYISTAKVEATTWNPFLSAVGSLKASNGVEVNNEVSGQVLAIFFHSGDHVKKGDLLVQLDDNVDQKRLESDQAKLRLDKLDYHRKETLLTQSAVSRSAVDTARATYLQSEAAVASDEVMLAKKKIRAPFEGRIGIRKVDIGQYLTPGTAVVSLQALDPLFVDFSLPEQFLSDLYKGQDVKIYVDAYPGETFDGKIIALNSKIDIDTRSIDVRANVPNKDEKLYPGLFADVNVILPKKENVMTVPQTAISYSLYGDSIYVVEQKGKDKKGNPELIAVQKFVKVGERRGTVVAILSGVKVGDTVVTSGQLKLHPNVRVEINNTVKLD